MGSLGLGRHASFLRNRQTACFFIEGFLRLGLKSLAGMGSLVEAGMHDYFLRESSKGMLLSLGNSRFRVLIAGRHGKSRFRQACFFS